MAKPIAVQLYTVRELCGKDVAGTLRALADIGYKGVELAGLYGLSAKDLGQMLSDCGLAVCGAHVGVPQDRSQAIALAEEYQALGVRRLVASTGPDQWQTLEKIQQVCGQLEAAAQWLAPLGVEFLYHNHWWEFEPVEGQVPHQQLVRQAPSVKLELDIYWTAFGGHDPAQVLAGIKDRTPLLHIKDGNLEREAPTPFHTAVGQGKIDVAGTIAVADPHVIDWLIVELDHCAGDMLQAVRDSYRYLTAHGLAEGNR